MNKEIEFLQDKIIHGWREVMKYERQMKQLDMNEQDAMIINTLREAAMEQVEIYQNILNKLEE